MSHLTRRLAFALGFFLSCIGCSRTADPVAKAEPSGAKTEEQAKPEGSGKLYIGDVAEATFGRNASTQLLTWYLRASNVKELMVRLVLARDGKSEVAQQTTYKWKTPTKEAQWKLCYLLQDGRTFGIKDKLFPSFALASPGTHAAETVTTGTATSFAKPASVSMQHDETTKRDVSPSNEEIVLIQLREKEGADVKRESGLNLRSIDGLTKASINGRTGVILLLEWK